MTTHLIEFDIAVRYRCRIDAATPEKAIERFWEEFENDGLNEVEIDSAGPTGLSMTNQRGAPIVWGGRTDLS